MKNVTDMYKVYGKKDEMTREVIDLLIENKKNFQFLDVDKNHNAKMYVIGELRACRVPQVVLNGERIGGLKLLIHHLNNLRSVRC